MDEHAIDELRLYIDNDEQLYRSQLLPIIKNVQRKMKSGKYNHDLAPKLWQYLVDNGARKYCKVFGGQVRYTFPKAEREQLAQNYADDYQENIRKVFWIDDLKHNDNTFGEPYNTREKAQEQIDLAYKFRDGSTFKEGDLVIREEFELI